MSSRGGSTRAPRLPPCLLAARSLMSAGVMPLAKIQWGFQVELTDRWLAGCEECQWFPPPYFAQDAADIDARNHNRVRHADQPVADRCNIPFEVADDVVKSTHRAMRFQLWWCIGYIVFLSLLSYLVFNTWAFLPITIGWSIMMAFYGRQFGRSEQRHAYAMERRHLLTIAFLEAQQEGEPGDPL